MIIVEGGKVCSMQISSDKRESRGGEKEGNKNKMIRMFGRYIHELEYVM